MKTFFVAAFAAGSLFFTACSENKKTEPSETGVYQCPMKCEGEKTYDKPGSCPVCQMDLQKSGTHSDEDQNEHNH